MQLQGFQRQSAVRVPSSRLGDHLRHGSACGGHTIRIQDRGAVAWVVDEPKFEQPALLEIEHGQAFVLTVFFGLCASVAETESVGHDGAELRGPRLVFGSAIEDLGAVGATIGGVAVNGEHALAAVGAGDVIAPRDRRGITLVNACADDGVTGGAEDLTEAIGVSHRDLGFAKSLAVCLNDRAGVVSAAPPVVVAVARVNADGEGHVAATVSMPNDRCTERRSPSLTGR